MKMKIVPRLDFDNKKMPTSCLTEAGISLFPPSGKLFPSEIAERIIYAYQNDGANSFGNINCILKEHMLLPKNASIRI